LNGILLCPLLSARGPIVHEPKAVQAIGGDKIRQTLARLAFLIGDHQCVAKSPQGQVVLIAFRNVNAAFLGQLSKDSVSGK
jgi:hypothetical protein